MMKKHNMLSWLLAFCLCFAMAMPAFATDIIEETVLMDNPAEDMFQVRGQVVFDDTYDNADNIVSYSNSVNSLSPQTAAFYNSVDEQTQQAILDYIAEGRTLKAVGWTKVFCKKDEDGNIIPETVEEVIKDIGNNISTASVVIGSENTSKSNFTLYTMVGYDNFDPDLLFAESIGIWATSNTSGTATTLAPRYDDFMSIDWPDGYFMQSSGISTLYEDAALKTTSSHGSVYSFREDKGEVRIISNGYNETSTARQDKWTSHYVHNWSNIALGFSYGSGGLNITGITNNKAWQIASYVNY